MSLSEGDDPVWTSCSNFKNDNKILIPSPHLFSKWIYCPHLVATALASHLYTAQLTADVQTLDQLCE